MYTKTFVFVQVGRGEAGEFGVVFIPEIVLTLDLPISYELYALLPWHMEDWGPGIYFAVASFYDDASPDESV